jgi:hypothetical protein
MSTNFSEYFLQVIMTSANLKLIINYDQILFERNWSIIPKMLFLFQSLLTYLYTNFPLSRTIEYLEKYLHFLPLVPEEYLAYILGNLFSFMRGFASSVNWFEVFTSDINYHHVKLLCTEIPLILVLCQCWRNVNHVNLLMIFLELSKILVASQWIRICELGQEIFQSQLLYPWGSVILAGCLQWYILYLNGVTTILNIAPMVRSFATTMHRPIDSGHIYA